MFGIYSAGWVFAARFYGEGNKREIKKTLGICLAGTVSIGFIFFILTLAMPEGLICYRYGDSAYERCDDRKPALRGRQGHGVHIREALFKDSAAVYSCGRAAGDRLPSIVPCAV